MTLVTYYLLPTNLMMEASAYLCKHSTYLSHVAPQLSHADGTDGGGGGEETGDSGIVPRMVERRG